MTESEVKALLAMIATNYPAGLRPEITRVTITTWMKLLGDVGYKACEAAILQWMAISKYPPTIADILERVTTASMPTTPDPVEAWKLITAAVVKFGRNWPNKARDWLGDALWRAADGFGWERLCNLDTREEMANYSQFRDSYITRLKREKEQAQIPASVRDALVGIGVSHIGRIAE